MRSTTKVCTACDPASAGLSKAQKRDLLGMSVAAVITTAIIGAPLFVPHNADARVAAEREVVLAHAATVVVARVPAPVVMRPLPDEPIPIRRPPAGPPAPVVRTSNGRRHAGVVSASVVRASTDLPRRPLVRRLAGLLTGDGSYSVRPFPSVSGDHQ